MKHSQKDLELARTYKLRFTLLKLIDQCRRLGCDGKFFHPKNDTLEWYILGRKFEMILSFYDKGGKLNEDFLLTLYDIKLSDNLIKKPILAERLLKLIRMN